MGIRTWLTKLSTTMMMFWCEVMPFLVPWGLVGIRSDMRVLEYNDGEAGA